MGAPPKHPSARQRTNRTSTAAILTRDPFAEAPALPTHPNVDKGDDWHPLAATMWDDVWKSPMAAEFDKSDVHGMYVLLTLYDDFYKAGTARQRAEIAAEIRLSGQRFGVSPIDRRRLQWQIEQTEEAQDRGRRRRGSRDEAPPAAAKTDPRSVLRSIG